MSPSPTRPEDLSFVRRLRALGPDYAPHKRGGAATGEEKAAASGGEGPSARPRRRAPLVVLVTLAVVGLLVVGVLPTRTFIAQRASLTRAEESLRVLSDQNRRMEVRVAALNTDAEVERLAREQFNLVRPGELSYAIIPSPPAPAPPALSWPFGVLFYTYVPVPASP
ncbi:hypothetical protein BH18ACT4_BH18ACT4_05140 [soil metagenome]